MWKDFWKSFITLFTLAKELEQTRTDVKGYEKGPNKSHSRRSTTG